MKTASTEPPGKTVPSAAAKAATAPKAPKARKARTSPQPAAAGPDGEDFDTRVRALAYSFYEARGCIDRHEAEDWARAEAELRREAAARQ